MDATALQVAFAKSPKSCWLVSALSRLCEMLLQTFVNGSSGVRQPENTTY